MKNQPIYGEPIHDFDFYLGTVIPFINIILWIVVIYAIVKLYRKLIKYLDKNSQN